MGDGTMGGQHRGLRLDARHLRKAVKALVEGEEVAVAAALDESGMVAIGVGEGGGGVKLEDPAEEVWARNLQAGEIQEGANAAGDLVSIEPVDAGQDVDDLGYDHMTRPSGAGAGFQGQEEITGARGLIRMIARQVTDEDVRVDKGQVFRHGAGFGASSPLRASSVRPSSNCSRMVWRLTGSLRAGAMA